MAARLIRLIVLGFILGTVVPSPAAAAIVRLSTSHDTVASVVPARGADPVYARSYFGARYYRADVGRFTTVDPAQTISENLVDPQRWNRYAYARNNPLKYTDPDGKNPVLVIVGAAWALYEIGSSIYDAYATYQTLRDPNASAAEKLTTGGLFAAGMLPGVPGGAASVERAAIRHGDDIVDAGFDSFRALKRSWGAAGEGQVWHHIVEQSKGAQFGDRMINAPGNVIAVSREINEKLNAFYSSKQAFSGKLTVREWLKGKSWQEQYRLGLEWLDKARKGEL
jgi:RHS repeat-associated protein